MSPIAQTDHSQPWESVIVAGQLPPPSAEKRRAVASASANVASVVLWSAEKSLTAKVRGFMSVFLPGGVCSPRLRSPAREVKSHGTGVL